MKEQFLTILRSICLGSLLAATHVGFADDTLPAIPPQASPPAEPAPVSVPAKPETQTQNPAPRRVHIIVDRKTEVGGNIVYEDENRITIERDGKRTEYKKDDIIDAIPLLDVQVPTLAVVYRRDGGSMQVQLVADDFDEVRYIVGTTPRSIPRAEVYRVGLTRSFEERYLALKKSIDPKDDVRRLALCDWLVSEKKYAQARTELVALVADTKLPEAVTLLNRVEAQLALMNAKPTKKRQKIGEDSALSDKPTDSQKAADARALPTRILTEAEMNLIRVYEIDFDNPPRVVIEPADARAFLEEFSSSSRIPPDAPSRNALIEGDPMKIVRLAFELKARDFYPKIRVVSEPSTLSHFRRNVHDGWLIANCATSRCHGGPDAGKFFLVNENRADARVRYTNLLNLLLGTSNDLPLIDFTDPSRSILIQYSLPVDEATMPHPTVNGWHSVFGRKLNPEKLANTISWIRSMYQPRPVYPIEYQPPDLRIPTPGTPADADEPTR